MAFNKKLTLEGLQYYHSKIKALFSNTNKSISDEATRATNAENDLESKKLDKTTVAGENLGLVKSGTDITVDNSGNVSVNDNSHKHTVSNISDLTATASELNVLDGITATTQELNYVDGVTSNIQTQLNSKSANDHTHSKLANENGSLLYEYTSGRNHLYSTKKDNLGTYGSPFNCLYADDVYLTSSGSLNDSLTKFVKKSEIAANLTTTTTGLVLDATMGKNLQDQITTNTNAISTLNSNIKKAPVNEYVITQNVATAATDTDSVTLENGTHLIVQGHPYGYNAMYLIKCMSGYTNSVVAIAADPYAELTIDTKCVLTITTSKGDGSNNYRWWHIIKLSSLNGTDV